MQCCLSFQVTSCLRYCRKLSITLKENFLQKMFSKVIIEHTVISYRLKSVSKCVKCSVIHNKVIYGNSLMSSKFFFKFGMKRKMKTKSKLIFPYTWSMLSVIFYGVAVYCCFEKCDSPMLWSDEISAKIVEFKYVQIIPLLRICGSPMYMKWCNVCVSKFKVWMLLGIQLLKVCELSQDSQI